MKNPDVNNQQRNYWDMKFKDILDWEKQSIYVNKNVHPTSTLTAAFLKTAGEAYQYVQFVFVPQKNWNHTQRQVSGFKNLTQPTQTKKSTIDAANIETKNSKASTSKNVRQEST